jgi:hypothetical protein
MTKRLAIFTVAFFALFGASCGAVDDYRDDRGRGDAPVANYDDSGAVVLNFPDRFSNVAVKCHGPNGVYVTTQNEAGKEMRVVANDPNCPGATTANATS